MIVTVSPLTDFERLVLDFERVLRKDAGAKDEAIWRTFAVSPARYLRFLDVVIKKTVIFGIVAGGLTLLLLIVVLLLPAATFGTGLTGWERGLLLFGVALGLLIGPLRRRARRFADRIVYGRRATPYEVLSCLIKTNPCVN